MISDLTNQELFPSQVLLEYEGGEHLFTKSATRLSYRDMAVELLLDLDAEGHPSLKVLALAVKSEIRAIRLTWQRPAGTHCRFAGDEWGEGNGNGQWRTMDPNRHFPWYVLVRTNEETVVAGVMTQAAAFASWNINPSQATLTLDVRNGTRGVRLDGRALDVATVLYCRYERTPMAAARRFCGIVSPEPILSSHPVYGILSKGRPGRSFDRGQILRECDALAMLCNNLTNRPFQVVDCGWEAGSGAGRPPCGPWNASRPEFGDMAGLADEIHRRGIRAGISMRLLRDETDILPQECHLECRPECLDPSLPQVLEHIQGSVRQAADWGFEMLRHLSSCRDCLGGVYRDLHAPPTWSFHDRSRTNAEILSGFYRAVKEARGDMLIYGEDIISHLGAGMLQLCRVSGDCAGDDWNRMRHNRVNALAFRLCQNENFYTVDVGALDLAAPQKWPQVRLLAELLSYANTAFFVSLDEQNPLPAKASKELSQDFLNASLGGTQVVPTDWMDNTCPQEWNIEGASKLYPWFG